MNLNITSAKMAHINVPPRHSRKRCGERLPVVLKLQSRAILVETLYIETRILSLKNDLYFYPPPLLPPLQCCSVVRAMFSTQHWNGGRGDMLGSVGWKEKLRGWKEKCGYFGKCLNSFARDCWCVSWDRTTNRHWTNACRTAFHLWWRTENSFRCSKCNACFKPEVTKLGGLLTQTDFVSVVHHHIHELSPMDLWSSMQLDQTGDYFFTHFCGSYSYHCQRTLDVAGFL